MIIIFNCIF